ncbi:Dml1p [Sugiyamaella lignohabitans]|uniref:Protein DML1 n=1 Tax=Sugiyamaella lignohabitans TaxID=796027 RepID=A0A167EK69_9ASCO|nr:Dml1p [Sugiyamaella lignohabitans]ANB14173.1 Dml1p [Sugiyamaella lignohabitans]
MHEVIHLSLSPISNHLNSHFYNAQESYFVYSDSEVADSKVDPTVRFQQGIGYTPRALVWDFQGGFGALKQYSGAYSDNNSSIPSRDIWEGGEPDRIARKQVTTSEYQKSLDSGNLTDPKLNKTNTLYWSDYIRVDYHPKSKLVLKDWEYDPIRYPKGRPRGSGESDPTPSSPTSASTASFNGYDIGISQWNQIQAENDKEYLDRSFRPILEQCDSLDGLVISTDVDSAWGGFTECMLSDIIDDYCPKVPRFVWGLYDQDLNGKKLSIYDTMSRIKSTAGLIENSTLFVPLSLPKLDQFPAELSKQIGLPLTTWQKTALYNMVYEPMSVLSSLRGNSRVSMSTLANSLTNGAEERKVVTAVSATSSLPLIDFSTVLTMPSLTPRKKVRAARYFSKYAVVRLPKPTPSLKPAVNNYGIVDLKSGASPWDFVDQVAKIDSNRTDLLEKYFDKQQLLDQGTLERNLSELKQEDFQFAQPSSFPSGIITGTDSLYSSFSITTEAGSTLTDMANFVSRFDRGSDEREQLKDTLSTMSEGYSWGYEFDSDTSDD